MQAGEASTPDEACHCEGVLATIERACTGPSSSSANNAFTARWRYIIWMSTQQIYNARTLISIMPSNWSETTTTLKWVSLSGTRCNKWLKLQAIDANLPFGTQWFALSLRISRCDGCGSINGQHVDATHLETFPKLGFDSILNFTHLYHIRRSTRAESITWTDAQCSCLSNLPWNKGTERATALINMSVANVLVISQHLYSKDHSLVLCGASWAHQWQAGSCLGDKHTQSLCTQSLINEGCWSS